MTPEKYNDLPVYLLENTPMERAELNSVCNKVQNKHDIGRIRFRSRKHIFAIPMQLNIWNLTLWGGQCEVSINVVFQEPLFFHEP